MPKREPHAVLGVQPGASQATIKAAWRRLAREHHPDLVGEDGAAKRSATRRMAEINAAYEALRAGRARAGRAGTDAPLGSSPSRRPAGPPPPKPSRPVTGRLDTSDTFRPRNATTTPRGQRAHPPGQPPLRACQDDREPPRASDPTGPLERARLRRHHRPPGPDLLDARAAEIGFGKFRGHTLGEIAAFEPSYIDWLARTITKDPQLVACARVIVADLDRRGVVRRTRAERANGRHPFQYPF